MGRNMLGVVDEADPLQKKYSGIIIFIYLYIKINLFILYIMEEQEATLEDYMKKTNHMFYVDFPWNDNENYLGKLKKYFSAGIVGYEISQEGTKHLQCYCIAPPNKYHSFIAQWKRDYKEKTGNTAVGRAKKGERRNYGRVKHLKKDVKYAMAYCMKDGMYETWNLDEAIVKEASEISYKPEKVKDKWEQMIECCKQHKMLWHEGDKLGFLAVIVKKHFWLYGTAVQKRAIDKYLLASNVVSAMDYVNANFAFYAQAYNPDNYNYSFE